MPLKVNLSTTKTGAAPTGWYTCEILTSKFVGIDTDYPRWSLFLKIVEGEYAGATASKTFWLNENGARELKTFLQFYYTPEELDDSDFEFDENAFVDRKVEAYLKAHKPRDGETNPPLNDVGQVRPFESNKGNVAIPDDFFGG